MVYCTYCGQSFTRDEHLERHILTHTNVKPFKCFTCHMSFARRDLLQRHYTVHGKDQNQETIPAADGMIPKSAGRTPIACSNCAKTKTKCDKKFPCSRCAGRNLKCTLRPTRRATKGNPRMGSGPDGSMTIEATAQPQTQDAPPPRPPLKPASPKNAVQTSEARPTIHFVEGQVNQRAVTMPTVASTPISQRSVPVPAIAATPVHGPVNEFMPDTSISYDDFSRPNTGVADSMSSPSFMLDWTQLQMPLGYDNILQPHLMMQPSPETMFDPPMLPLAQAPTAEGMLSILPDVANGVMTPDDTPKVERALEEININSSNSGHASRHSIGSAASKGELVGEMPAIITARDAWSTFRCTPTVSSSLCPKTARLHLERLELTLKDHEGWSSWTPQWAETHAAAGDYLTVMQLHESTRDKLLAIMQSFLHKALEIHREGVNHNQLSRTGLPTPNGASNFVLLPPARVLEYFLRSYANSFERYYPLTSRGTLDVNELMHCYNDRAASLLVLMMIAQGAMVEARMLTGGLTEASRISLFDLIEKNIIMASDPIVLHAALLFTVQAAWSGDKWQMDIAKGQRNMYFSMLRHSGALESHQPPPEPRQNVNTDQLWVEWIQAESRSRLVYSSVMIDQELALFNDMAPLISVTECTSPMPDADQLWHTKTAAQWSSIFEQVHEFSLGFSSVGSGARPPSLRDVFRQFLDGELDGRGDHLTPLQLRLLLSPLQSQVTQLSQLLACFSTSSMHASNNIRTPTKATARARLEEIQALLGSWFALAERYLKYHPMCPMMQTNLIIFHLISANAVTDFPEIERLARGEAHHGDLGTHLRQRCIVDIEEAVFHSGQVLRNLRSMSRAIRPPWWTAAVYRVALILWTHALLQGTSTSPHHTHFPAAGPSLAIDNVSADHPLVIRYLTKREGVPCVTKRDGGQMGIETPFAILRHCVDVIDEGAATRFSDGMRAKLERLAARC